MLRIGHAASTFWFGAIFANSHVQNFFTTGSVTLFTTLFLYTSLVSISGIEISVELGYSIKAKIVFLKICSSLGPHESQNIFLNIQTKPDATRGLSSGLTLSSILNAIGHSVSLGSKIIVWFVLDFGINQITDSAKSPCGSITATHLPFLISSIIIFSKRTDFHIQVFHKIYICLLLSFGKIPKLISVHLKFVFQIGVKSVSGTISSVKSGSIIGKFEGGSKLRADTQFICGVFT